MRPGIKMSLHDKLTLGKNEFITFCQLYKIENIFREISRSKYWVIYYLHAVIIKLKMKPTSILISELYGQKISDSVIKKFDPLYYNHNQSEIVLNDYDKAISLSYFSLINYLCKKYEGIDFFESCKEHFKDRNLEDIDYRQISQKIIMYLNLYRDPEANDFLTFVKFMKYVHNQTKNNTEKLINIYEMVKTRYEEYSSRLMEDKDKWKNIKVKDDANLEIEEKEAKELLSKLESEES